MTGPIDPMTVAQEAAAQMHEMFTSYVRAGFSEQQALYLIGQILRGMAGSSSAPSS